MTDETESNVVVLDVQTSLDIPVQRVLDGAKEVVPEKIMIIGYTKDDEIYFANSFGDAKEWLWLLEKVKEYVLED